MNSLETYTFCLTENKPAKEAYKRNLRTNNNSNTGASMEARSKNPEREKASPENHQFTDLQEANLHHAAWERLCHTSSSFNIAATGYEPRRVSATVLKDRPNSLGPGAMDFKTRKHAQLHFTWLGKASAR